MYVYLYVYTNAVEVSAILAPKITIISHQGISLIDKGQISVTRSCFMRPVAAAAAVSRARSLAAAVNRFAICGVIARCRRQETREICTKSDD